MNIPKSFSLKVKNSYLLKNGLPYIYHEAYKCEFSFKTLNIANRDGITTLTGAKQQEIFYKLKTSIIKKPLLIGIGSFPTDKGCNAVAANLLYYMKDVNKSFNIFTISSLITTPELSVKQFGSTIPEVLCIMDLCDESGLFSYSIENTRALISCYRNSVLIIPVVTKNIADFFKTRLHKTGVYLQFTNLRKIEEV